MTPTSDTAANVANTTSSDGPEVITEISIDANGHVTGAKKKRLYVSALSTSEIDDAIAAAESAVSLS